MRSSLLASLALLGLGLAVLSAPAAARMYQWVNPVTGRVELSGTPPGWYRGDAPGPRVQVFENGRLIDDTAIALDPKQNEVLREAAFKELEERQRAEAVKRLERAARRQAARQAEAERQLAEAAPDATGEPAPAEGAKTPEGGVPEQLDSSVIDQLKSLIQAWDRQFGGAK